MGNSYSDQKYGVIHRQWFGLTRKWGGSWDEGYTCTSVAHGFGSTDATSATILQAWYPKGPIKMLKFGCFAVATMTQASSDVFPVYLKTRSSSASAACTLNMKDTSTAISQAHINSTTTFTVSQVKAGEYVYIRAGTPKTDGGTAANTASMTGTVAFFIDYIPTYSSKWDT